MTIDALALTVTKAQTVASRPAANQFPQTAPIQTVNTANVKAAPPVDKVDIAEIRDQVASINRALQEKSSNLSFSVDEGTGRTVVRVFRKSTGELVRQIPSEEVLAIAASIKRGEGLTSLGVDELS